MHNDSPTIDDAVAEPSSAPDRQVSRKLLEIDHITPVKEGGDNDEGNLLAACGDCNRGKGANPLSSAPKTLTEQTKEIEEREAQLLGYRDVVQKRTDRIDADTWAVADAIVKESSEKGMRRDWLRSIKTFNERLPLHEVLDAAEIAYVKKLYSEGTRFKYFCGICWKKIREGADA